MRFALATGCGELKDLGGWKSRVVVDRYAKFGTASVRGGIALELGAKENAEIYVTISPRFKEKGAAQRQLL